MNLSFCGLLNLAEKTRGKASCSCRNEEEGEKVQEARLGFCLPGYKRLDLQGSFSLSRLICGKGNRKGNIVEAKVTVKVTL